MIMDKEMDFCLLIPCYNNTQGLMASLKSIFYDNDQFAVVIVDDGSTVPISQQQIKSEFRNIESITVLRNQQNMGITDAMNRGLEWIEDHVNARYIARLDCGDRCHPHRFYRQMEYLNTHPEIGLLGSWCIFEDRKLSMRFLFKTPTEHERIKRAMHSRNVFIHSTTIFRTTLLKTVGHYPSEFAYAEDYAFFWKLLNVTRSHILDEVLIIYEINHEGLSIKNRRTQLASRAKIISKFGSDRLRKTAGILRAKALSIIPKHLALLAKFSLKDNNRF
jgi:glycosyltransferase involved in cell wall biosynthesis